MPETLDWIKTKLEGTDDWVAGEQHLRNFKINFEKCFCTYSFDYINTSGIKSYRSYFKFAFARISRVDIYKLYDGQILGLYSQNDDKSIKKWLFDYNKPNLFKNNSEDTADHTTTVEFRLPSDLNADRFLKAFGTAVKLCGGGNKLEKY